MNTRAMELVTNEDGRVVGVRCQQDGGFFLGNTVYNTGKNIAADLLYHGMIVSAQGKRCINDGASYANNDLINEFERQFAQQPEDYLWFVCSEEAKEYYDLNNATYGLTDEDYASGDTLEALAEAMGSTQTTLSRRRPTSPPAQASSWTPSTASARPTSPCPPSRPARSMPSRWRPPSS